METELIRIAAIGIIIAVIALMISVQRPEMSILLGLAFGAMVLIVAFSKAGSIIGVIKENIDAAGIDSKLLVPVLKVTGMAYITQFAVDICSDCGQKAIATKIEIVGKIMMLAVSVPIATSIIKVIASIL
ncbi:MAG: stage III sporulation protein AD [Clostridiaceae bacterium]|nr:stage III sporulation protein AD [Clostridiaceae bacterium]